MNDKELREILIELADLAKAGGEGSLYGDLGAALKEIDSLLDFSDISKQQRRIAYLIGTTGNLQELSMECGWAAPFDRLATRLEAFCEEQA